MIKMTLWLGLTASALYWPVAQAQSSPSPSPVSSPISSPAPLPAYGMAGSPRQGVLPARLETVPEVILANTREIKAGQSVAAFLADLARAEGWTLIWEAPDFVVEQTVPVSSDLMRAFADLVSALAASGTEATAYFYRGNKVIHVTERSK